MTDPVRAVLADDHDPTRAGVRIALEAGGFKVVGEAANAPDAVALALSLEPDVVVLDVYMPGGGIAAVRQIKAARQDMAVVMLSAWSSDDDLVAAVVAGAEGYLMKTMSADRMPDALRGVLAGEAALPRALAARLMRELRSQAQPGRTVRGRTATLHALLTEREREIGDLMLEDRSTDGMAAALGISAVTVRRHISAVVRKAGAKDRREAVRCLRAESKT